MYDDMNVLKENFDDVYKLIDDEYADIFGIDKSHQNKRSMITLQCLKRISINRTQILFII